MKLECAFLSSAICFTPEPSKLPTAAPTQSEFDGLPIALEAITFDKAQDAGSALATTRSASPEVLTWRTATMSSKVPPERFPAATARHSTEPLESRSPAPTGKGVGPRKIEK